MTFRLPQFKLMQRTKPPFLVFANRLYKKKGVWMSSLLMFVPYHLSCPRQLIQLVL